MNLIGKIWAATSPPEVVASISAVRLGAVVAVHGTSSLPAFQAMRTMLLAACSDIRIRSVISCVVVTPGDRSEAGDVSRVAKSAAIRASQVRIPAFRSSLPALATHPSLCYNAL